MNLLLSVLLPVLKNIHAVLPNDVGGGLGFLIGGAFILVIGVVIVLVIIFATKYLNRINKNK
jgi:hypothetical protein